MNPKDMGPAQGPQRRHATITKKNPASVLKWAVVKTPYTKPSSPLRRIPYKAYAIPVEGVLTMVQMALPSLIFIAARTASVRRALR